MKDSDFIFQHRHAQTTENALQDYNATAATPRIRTQRRGSTNQSPATWPRRIVRNPTVEAIKR